MGSKVLFGGTVMIQNILISIAFFALIIYIFKKFASSSFSGSGVSAKKAPQQPDKIIHIENLADFDEYVESSGISVVDFTASWCGPCQYIAPSFAKLSYEYQNLQFLKVDVDACATVKAKCNIKAMPTFQFWKNGKKLEEFIGADEGRVKELVKKYAA